MTVQQQFRRRLFFLGFIWLTVIAASAHAQSSSKKVRIGVSETHVSYLPAEEVQFLIDLMRTNAKIPDRLRWSRSLTSVLSIRREKI
jgi:hypothetical protein